MPISTFRYFVVGFLVIMLMSGCTTTKKSRDYTKSRPKSFRTKKPSKTKKETTAIKEVSLRNKLVDTALEYQGIAYVYGGKTPKGFDCSGFTSYVFNQMGLELRGASFHQVSQGTKKSLTQAEPGDLVFFETNGRVAHVSIVIKNDDDELWVVHSTSTRGVVKDEILHSSYWKPKISEIRDVIDRYD